MVELDRTLEFNSNTSNSYDDEIEKCRRRGNGRRRHMHMSHMRSTDPMLDINPDTGRPYLEGLEVDTLGCRPIRYGKKEKYPVHPATGSSWDIEMR